MALRHHWKLDEALATDVAVDSVGGADLTPASGVEPAVVTDPRFGYVRRWGTGYNQYLSRAGTLSASGNNGSGSNVTPHASPLSVAFRGAEWSASFWLRLRTDLALSVGILNLGKPGDQTCLHTAPATTHASGHAHSVRPGHLNIHVDSSEFPGWTHAYAASSVRSGGPSKGLSFQGIWIPVAYVRRDTDIEIWWADTMLHSSAFVSEPYTPQDDYDAAGFMPGPDTFTIGRAQSGGSLDSFIYGYEMDLAHVRIYDHALTEAEIIDLAAPSLDDTAPVISNVTPAAGTPMGRHDAWAFRVTDDVGYRRTMVWATLKDSTGRERGKEVIWDGSDFSTTWSAGTRTEVTAGKVYDFASIRRNGGIPHHITDVVFDVAAIDTSGNEGT